MRSAFIPALSADSAGLRKLATAGFRINRPGQLRAQQREWNDRLPAGRGGDEPGRQARPGRRTPMDQGDRWRRHARPVRHLTEVAAMPMVSASPCSVRGILLPVKELLRQCRKGPRFAMVNSIAERPAEPPQHPGQAHAQHACSSVLTRRNLVLNASKGQPLEPSDRCSCVQRGETCADKVYINPYQT